MRDETVDNLRSVKWYPPIPIPGMSRAAIDYLGPHRAGPGSQGFARRFYQERAQRLAEFVASSEFRDFIGARPDLDWIEAEEQDPSLPDARFRQAYRGSSPAAGMLDGSVTLHLNGAWVEGVSTTFEHAFAPASTVLQPSDAVAAALELTFDRGLPTTEASDLVPLLGLRERRTGSVPMPAGWVPRDLLLYKVVLYNPDAVSLQRVQVLVDAATGEPYSVHFLKFDGESGTDSGSVKLQTNMFKSTANKVICQTQDGFGTDMMDVNGIGRLFSTTYGVFGAKTGGTPTCSTSAW